MQGELIPLPGRAVSPPLPVGLPASSLGLLIKHSGSLPAAPAHSHSSPWITKHLAQLALPVPTSCHSILPSGIYATLATVNFTLVPKCQTT